MSKRSTYHNRYMSINRVVMALGESDGKTATMISKEINLSRQAILDVLKHAETWGYVTHREEPHRVSKNGEVLVVKKIWKATKYGLENAKWLDKAIRNHEKTGQLVLL